MNKVSAKEAFDKIKPQSVALVTSVDRSSNCCSMLCRSFGKCSSEPPLMAVCLPQDCQTVQAINYSKEFVVSLTNKQLEKEVKFFSTYQGDFLKNFEQTVLENVETKNATYLNSPLLKKASVNLECYLEQQLKTGDHVLFIGKILAAYIRENEKILFNVEKIGQEYYYQEF